MVGKSDQERGADRAGPRDAPDTLPPQPQTKPLDSISKVVLAVGIAVPVIFLIVAILVSF